MGPIEYVPRGAFQESDGGAVARRGRCPACGAGRGVRVALRSPTPMAIPVATCSCFRACSWGPMRVCRSRSRCSSAICCRRRPGRLPGSGRDHRAPRRPRRGDCAMAPASRIRQVSRDRAVAGLQAAAAGGDAERVRLQLARALDGAGLPAARQGAARPAGLFGATQTAVRRSPLPAALRSHRRRSGGGAVAALQRRWQRGASRTAGPSGAPAVSAARAVALLLVAVRSAALAAARATARRRRRIARLRSAPGACAASRGVALSGVPRGGAVRPRRAVALAVAEALVVVLSASPSPSAADALASNAYLDPGTSLSASAPDFTLSDQFGQRLSLHSFRGKVVILAFNDSECTTSAR